MTTNLLNLNVDTLFEQHSVPEIDIIQKKIQAVVENKREELRTMVGERYRDLLQAADTITSMQNSAGILIQQIDEITSSCQQQQVSGGFKNLDTTTTAATTTYISQRNANKELNNYFSTMVQIKLLSSLPEMIWSKIDQEHFYAATELFVFSRHISTGLQLDANNELMRHLPVAKKQWEILKPFHMTIKQNVIKVLEREELSAEIAADCLLSLLLLEKSSLNAVIKTFLQLRCNAFLACLSDASTKEETKEVRRIKARILASLKVLNDTMTLLSNCLLPNVGLVYKKLATITAATAVPTLTYTEETQHAHLLPEIISNFRPKFDLQPLAQAEAAASIEQWLQQTASIANSQLKQLFRLVSDMNTIQHIKTAANDLKNQLDLTALVAYFELKNNLDFYEIYYKPLINQRVRDIIQQNWATAIDATYATITEALRADDLDEHNIWQESAADLPASLEIALNDDRKMKSLLMRTKGYDANILNICEHFDKQLAAIVAEMNVLLGEQNAKAAEKVDMVEYLRSIATQQLTEFLCKLKDLNLGHAESKQLLFIIRCCTALIELCPNLKNCCCPTVSWRQWLGNEAAQQATTSLEHWQKLCLQFETEVQEFWCTILKALLEAYNCELFMPANLTAVTLMEDFVLWDTITVQQQNEQNDNISSTFRIPNQPRISLQTFLFDLINKLNLIVPETLPAKVVTAFNQMLLQQLLKHYENLAQLSNELSANQHIPLQLYFDLKFLHASFCVYAREARDLAARFQKLFTIFKDMVDPFDFELFAEYIAENVKRAVSRLSCEFGVILPSDVVASSTSTAPATVVAHEKDPNVLSLSTNASNSVWFPLLPIVTGTNSKMRVQPTIAMEQQTSSATPTRKSSSRKSNSDANQKSKSSATSFFGAMSQEWFR